MTCQKTAYWRRVVRSVRRLAHTHGFSDFFDLAATEIAGLLGADGAALITCEDAGWLRYRLFHGLDMLNSQALSRFRFRADSGTAGAVLQAGTPVFTPDYPASALAMPEFVQAGLKANFVLPVPGPDGPLGVLAVAWTRHPPRSIHRFQREAAEMFAALLGSALHRERLEAQLREESLHDALTGLPNRRLLLSRLLEAQERAQRHERLLVVAMVDLDGFKGINDALGHAVGDRVLVSAAARIREMVRRTDTIARVGGDEFVVVLEDVQRLQDAEVTLGRIVRALRVRARVNGHSRDLGASLGVAVYPFDDCDAESLLQRADHAMYRMKREGGDGIRFYDPIPDAEHLARDEIKDALRHALETRLGLEFQYQPIVRLADGVPVAAEALLRWRHPQLGWLLPAAFLDAVAHDPLMVRLGIWTLSEASRQLQQWQSQGLSLAVHVNVGDRCIETQEFARALKAQLVHDPDGVGGRLRLEIVERTVPADREAIGALVVAAQAAGVETWIDDFGTGYACLATLRESPVAGIKIDARFVANMGRSPADLAIIEGILMIARACGLEVVAEGVETAAQADCLRSLGCPLGQGYYLGRPMAAEVLAAWVKDGPGKPAAPGEPA